MAKPTDVDLTYFVTAHELGHQWWGHQLIGGQVEGSNMMSETDALRAQTPPELQYLIDDGFNRIVLYDNKTVSAT